MKHSYSKPVSILLILSLMLSVFAFTGVPAYAASAKKPEYIAHRGWSTRAPENTLAAFRLAARNKGFYGVEFDVWEASAKKTQDPLLLVMHDENIKRMCGVSKNIRKISRKTLGKYTIKSGKNVRKYKGQKIPTAEEALETIYSYSKGAIPVIELKHRLSSRALSYLLASLKDRKAVVISFNFNAVADTVSMARKMGISENVQTFYLMKKLSAGKYSSTIRRLKAAGIDGISLKYYVVSKKTVKRFHRSGIKVCVWTLPNRKTARKYVKMGVDYITSNGAIF